jgi:hypothetical protein
MAGNEISTEDKRDFARFRALVTATDAGVKGAMGELQDFLKANAWAARLGDISLHVMSALIGKLTKKTSNCAMFGAVIAEREQQMGYADAVGVEKMLIERVMMCWIRLLIAESYCTNIEGKGLTFNHHEFAERSLSRAHNGFLRACEALERYRLLAQATKIATARADLLDAKAGEARTNKANGAMRLLKSQTG